MNWKNYYYIIGWILMGHVNFQIRSKWLFRYICKYFNPDANVDDESCSHLLTIKITAIKEKPLCKEWLFYELFTQIIINLTTSISYSPTYPSKLNWCVKSILFNLYRTILCGSLMRMLFSLFRMKKSICKLFWQEYLSKMKWFKSDFWFC